MRHQVLNAIVLTTTLMLVSHVHSAELDMHFLKYGHMSCPNEQDVADIASANGAEAIKTKMSEKIYSGACTAAVMPMRRIVQLTTKNAPNGGAYFCFRGVDLEIVGYEPLQFEEVIQEKIECAPSFLVTTLAQELAERKGDFVIMGKGPFGVKVKCSEGGTVTLFKRNGVWWRTQEVIPLPRYETKLVTTDVDLALRDGCRGGDVNLMPHSKANADAAR